MRCPLLCLRPCGGRWARRSLVAAVHRPRPWNGAQDYADTKLHAARLAFAVARRWPGTLSNAMEPGWVATRMGGPRATGDLDAAHRTQAWLAVDPDPPAATATGGHVYPRRPRPPSGAVHDTALQDGLLAACEGLNGIAVPRP